MNRTGTKERWKIKIVSVMAILATISAMGSYGYYIYGLFIDAQRQMPKPQIEKLVKDLRTYQKLTGRFPQNFKEINERLWHTSPPPEYGPQGRQARVKNYYYFYTRVHDRQCAIWAIPLGPQKNYAKSFFLVLTPEWLRRWQGRAVEESHISRLPSIPSAKELIHLAMIEY